MPLTQTERDLKRYAEHKLVVYIKDIKQSFEILGLKQEVIPCLGALLLHTAVKMAVVCGSSKETILKWVEDYYDDVTEEED